jgi:hypothetical protein
MASTLITVARQNTADPGGIATREEQPARSYELPLELHLLLQSDGVLGHIPLCDRAAGSQIARPRIHCHRLLDAPELRHRGRFATEASNTASVDVTAT